MPKTMTIIGNIGTKPGNKPELKETKGGKPVCEFSLATYAGKDHEGHKKTTWVKVTTWGTLAKLVSEKIEGGSRLQVTGILNEPDVWLGKTDNKQHAVNSMTAFSVSRMPKDVKYEDLEAGDIAE